MTKKTAMTLMLVGAALEVGDRVTAGKLYGASGLLAPVNNAIPKLNIAGIQTNLGVWLIVIGGVAYLV